MILKCKCGATAELSDATILAEAGRIYNRRRKVHKGAPPQTYACHWCHAAVAGRDALAAHERACPEKRAFEPITPADFVGVTLADLPAAD